MRKEKFLVIGSNSFSGSNFVAHLLGEGLEVSGISRSSEPIDAFLPYKWQGQKGFSFYQLDLNCDLEKIMSLVEDVKPDYIVNFAAQGMVAQSWQSPQDWFMTNTLSMVRLQQRLKDCGFLKKYVQISTPEVYGNTKGLIKEDAAFNPTTPYAVSKAACDMSLLSFYKFYNFPVVFTRAANVCGPGQQLYRIIPKTIISILLGQKLKLEGGGISERSFIHIRDVCDGTLKICRYGRLGEAYHFATKQTYAIRQLVETICRLMQVSFEDSVEIVPGRRAQDAAYILDCTKAKEQLGWEPLVSLEEIILETITWIREDLDILKRQPIHYIHKP